MVYLTNGDWLCVKLSEDRVSNDALSRYKSTMNFKGGWPFRPLDVKQVLIPEEWS